MDWRDSDYRERQIAKKWAEAEDEIDRLRAENEVLRRLVKDLRDVGTFAVSHVFSGDCPDELLGHSMRDTSCPACKVLIAADDFLRGEGE